MQRKHDVCAACGNALTSAFTPVDAANFKFAACARRGVTCQINSGAKHLVAIPNSLDGISNLNIARWCISLFIGLVTRGSTANRIRQLPPAVLPCSSEALAKVELLRPAMRSFRFLLLGVCGVAVDAFPSVEMSASAPDK
jgi:hypothetical protein